MAKLPLNNNKLDAGTPAPATTKESEVVKQTFTADEVEELVARALLRNAQPALNPEALANALVRGTKQVNEEAAIINKEAKSRADRMKEVEGKIQHLNDEVVKPYLTYSTELYPHAAPTVGGHDFPKYILKRSGKKFGNDVAAKKVTWLTDREAARIRLHCELKFASIKAQDEHGNPILDKRTNQPKNAAVPFSAFIRLVPTVVADGNAIDDPAELVTAMAQKLSTIEQELAAFKAGGMAQVAKQPEFGAINGADAALTQVNARLKTQKTEAMAAEAEAAVRFGNDLPKGGPIG